MSFWANKNSSTILINSGRDVEIKRLIFAPLCYLLGRRHGPEFHGDANESPETEKRKREGEEERIWGRESGLDSWSGKPLVPGLSSCWLGRVSSAAGPQKCQSRERCTDLQSYGNKTNSESAEVSYARYAVIPRGHLWAGGRQLQVTHQETLS